MRSILFSIVISILFIGCKEIPIIVPANPVPDTDRVVLIEEFTGVKCKFCPDGARTLADLKEINKENMVTVAFHCSFLADPHPDSKFDFRTEKGEEIETYLGQSPKPNIAVNRKWFDDEEMLTMSLLSPWGARISERLTGYAQIHIEIKNSFDTTSRKLTSKITIDPQNDLEGDFYLSAYITESNIIDYQIDGETLVSDYQHNHVFRDAISNTLGDVLPSNLKTNQLVERTFEYTIPDEDGWWIPENCDIVAFVSEIDADAGTKEVLQADEKAVFEE